MENRSFVRLIGVTQFMSFRGACDEKSLMWPFANKLLRDFSLILRSKLVLSEAEG
jgi:hypothetical protein